MTPSTHVVYFSVWSLLQRKMTTSRLLSSYVATLALFPGSSPFFVCDRKHWGRAWERRHSSTINFELKVHVELIAQSYIQPLVAIVFLSVKKQVCLYYQVCYPDELQEYKWSWLCLSQKCVLLLYVWLIQLSAQSREFPQGIDVTTYPSNTGHLKVLAPFQMHMMTSFLLWRSYQSK